jgi:hypothetical protein
MTSAGGGGGGGVDLLFSWSYRKRDPDKWTQLSVYLDRNTVSNLATVQYIFRKSPHWNHCRSGLSSPHQAAREDSPSS